MNEPVQPTYWQDAAMSHFDAIGDELRGAAAGISAKWWWLSFVEPETDTFLGVAIVSGADPLAAVRRAHTLGINPGGDVAVFDIPPGRIVYSDGYRGRLLTLRDLGAMDFRLPEPPA